MKEIVKLGSTLFVVAALAAGILAFSNDVTEGVIKEVEEAQSSGPAVANAVIPGSVGFEKVEGDIVEQILAENEKFVELRKGIDENGNTLGYAIRTKSIKKGYGGDIEIFLGISNEGEIVGMKILSLSETPGLGSNVQKPEFQKQYFGKSADMTIEVTKSIPKENEIVAVSGATISSRSITSAVNNALDIYNKYIK